MRNMMSQVKNWSKISLLFFFLLLPTGCKNDPFSTKGNVENPQWVVTVDNNMTASMTATVKVSIGNEPGTLAAFIGYQCCGIAKPTPITGNLSPVTDYLYFLYISPATEEGGEIQLKYYSPDLKRIFDATGTFPFRNDTHLGTVPEPYTPNWKLAE